MKLLFVARITAYGALGWVAASVGPMWATATLIVLAAVIDVCSHFEAWIPLQRRIDMFQSLSDQVAKGMR